MTGGRFGLAPQSGGRTRGESIVPMINIVFLLLVFFMLSATIAPPDPFEMNLPDARQSDAPLPPRALLLAVAQDGRMSFAGVEGAAALAALGDAFRPGDTVLLRADAGLDGGLFAGLLGDLAALGVSDVRLTVRPQAIVP